MDADSVSSSKENGMMAIKLNFLLNGTETIALALWIPKSPINWRCRRDLFGPYFNWSRQSLLPSRLRGIEQRSRQYHGSSSVQNPKENSEGAPSAVLTQCWISWCVARCIWMRSSLFWGQQYEHETVWWLRNRSFGLPLATAVTSLALRQAPKTPAAYTGRIFVDGAVGAIGGLPAKLKAAKKNKMILYIPFGSQYDAPTNVANVRIIRTYQEENFDL